MSGGTALTSTARATRLGAVTADVARHLAASGGEPDEGDITEVERLDDGGEIIGVGVHLVAVPRLCRAAVAAAVMGDAAVAA